MKSRWSQVSALFVQVARTRLDTPAERVTALLAAAHVVAQDAGWPAEKVMAAFAAAGATGAAKGTT